MAPADRLAAALQVLAPGYTYESTVAVGGKLATRADGRWIGGAAEIVVESGGASITYRTVPPRSWAQEQDGSWVELEGQVPGGDPLDRLLNPRAAEVERGATDTISIRATYAPAALGLAGSDPVTVTLAIAADGSVSARYVVDTKAGTATSTTVFYPALSQAPIVAPSAAPSARP